MKEPLRVDKEDRYHSTNTANDLNSSPKQTPKLSKSKWIMLLIALLIIVLLLSFAIFKPSKSDETSPSNDSVMGGNAVNPEFSTLVPPEISREATHTQQQLDTTKERIEIPGEVTDQLTNKIIELNQDNDNKAIVHLNSESHQLDKNYNELPLNQNLESDHFTIQINASSSLENMMAYVKHNTLTNYQIYETTRFDAPWYILIKGNYPTASDAKKAMLSLHNDLQKNRPWIKSGTAVNKEKLSNVR